MLQLLITAARRQLLASIVATLAVALCALCATFADGQVPHPRALLELTAPIGGALAAFGLTAQFAREGGLCALYALGNSARSLLAVRLLVLLPFLAFPHAKNAERTAINEFSYSNDALTLDHDLTISWSGERAQRSDSADIFVGFPRPPQAVQRDYLYIGYPWRFILRVVIGLFLCFAGVCALSRPQSTERSLAYAGILTAALFGVGQWLT